MLSTTKSLLSLTAADIMSREIVMIPREMSLQGAARMLARASVTGAPVVDSRGRCIGVLSATDFMHWVEKDPQSKKPQGDSATPMCLAWEIVEGAGDRSCCCVEEYMTKDPVLVAPGTRIGELARLMIDAHIHRLIVVDPASQQPIGIVSSTDVLAVLARLDQMQLATQEHKAAEAPKEEPAGAIY